MLAILPLISIALAAAPAAPCEPSPEVAALLLKSSATSADPQGGWLRAASLLRDALKANPGDLFLQDALLSARLYSFEEDPAAIAAEHKGAGAGDPVAVYLHARATAAANPQEGVALARQALKALPGFPWPHLVLAEHLAQGPLKDPAAASAAVRGFQRACPGALAGFQAANQLTDAALARDSARKLRPLLESQAGERARLAFSTLWSLEAKAGLSARPDWKERVAADLKRLRAAPGEPSQALLKEIAEGAQIAGDMATVLWAQTELDRRFPNPSEQFMAVAYGFYAGRGAPEPTCGDAPADRALLDATAGWVARWPDLLDAWRERLDAMEDRADVPVAEVERAAARIRALAAQPGADRATLLNVASAFASRGVHLDEVPALVEQGVAGSEARDRKYAIAFKRLPPEEQAQLNASAGGGFWTGAVALVNASLKASKVDAAAERVAAMRARLEQDRAAAKDPARKTQLDKREARLWKAAADVALARGRKADAVAFLARADRLQGCDAAHASAKLQKTWKELGGTPEGLAPLLQNDQPRKAEEASTWTGANVAIPPFSAKDLGGRSWTAKDLRGKVVFGNVWATWCEPCKIEMPFVRKLRDRYAGRKDVVILTLNTDANPALVKPFVEQTGFDVPVLMDPDLAGKLGLGTSLPASFVADAGGVVRFTSYGLSVDGEERWLKAVSDVIDRVSAR